MQEETLTSLKGRQFTYDSENCDKWHITNSEISGSGVFSSKEIQTEEVIFKELPLVIGPRAAPLPVACVSCLKLGVPLSACPAGCRLPLCSDICSTSAAHLAECAFLRERVKPGEHWSPLLYRALAPLRILLLHHESKQIVSKLARNNTCKLIEIHLLKKELDVDLTAEEESFLEVGCHVLNGVAFEMDLAAGDLVSWRGLYPLAGTMNHSCSPNTARFSDGCPLLTLVAAKPIAAGEEITTSYCPLVWSTPARREWLRITKEFLCSCQRCSDPTEFGTYFSAQQCSCDGYILPGRGCTEDWRCRSCGRSVTTREVLAAERGMVQGKLSPHRNSFIAMQQKIKFIWKIGHQKRPYSDVSDDELRSKQKAIKDVMDTNDALRLGESRIKVRLREELKDTEEELKKRKEKQLLPAQLIGNCSN